MDFLKIKGRNSRKNKESSENPNMMQTVPYFGTIFSTWNLVTQNNYSFSGFYHTAWMAMNKIINTLFVTQLLKIHLQIKQKNLSDKTNCKLYKNERIIIQPTVIVNDHMGNQQKLPKIDRTKNGHSGIIFKVI